MAHSPLQDAASHESPAHQSKMQTWEIQDNWALRWPKSIKTSLPISSVKPEVFFFFQPFKAFQGIQWVGEGVQPTWASGKEAGDSSPLVRVAAACRSDPQYDWGQGHHC